MQRIFEVARSALMCCVLGAVAALVLFLFADGSTGHSISLSLYPLVERMDKLDGHVDSLGWDFGICIFFMLVGSVVGSGVGVWRGLKRRR